MTTNVDHVGPLSYQPPNIGAVFLERPVVHWSSRGEPHTCFTLYNRTLTKPHLPLSPTGPNVPKGPRARQGYQGYQRYPLISEVPSDIRGPIRGPDIRGTSELPLIQHSFRFWRSATVVRKLSRSFPFLLICLCLLYFGAATLSIHVWLLAGLRHVWPLLECRFVQAACSSQVQHTDQQTKRQHAKPADFCAPVLFC